MERSVQGYAPFSVERLGGASNRAQVRPVTDLSARGDVPRGLAQYFAGVNVGGTQSWAGCRVSGVVGAAST